MFVDCWVSSARREANTTLTYGTTNIYSLPSSAQNFFFLLNAIIYRWVYVTNQINFRAKVSSAYCYCFFL